MPKPTSTKKPAASVDVYNHTTRRLGCYLAMGKDAHGQVRPQRLVAFVPGNNKMPKADLDACQANATFLENFSVREVLGRTGKKIKRKNLDVGRTDPLQASEEDKLAQQLEAARKAAAAGA